MATGTLLGLLESNNGCVSSRALREALQTKGLENARPMVARLRYFDFDSPPEGNIVPARRWHFHARSFFSDEKFRQIEAEQSATAERAGQASPAPEEEREEGEVIAERRTYRQEESRLGTYVTSALENIYQSDVGPEDARYVFDVHSERAGSEFENVDVIAVHWRSRRVVELVTVEIKLAFTTKLVQQARNYARFSDRVWIAVPVPVPADAGDAGAALRDYDPLLFEHVVDSGLGILACRRRPGRSYDVLPVQWPRRLTPDPVEKEALIERYRACFEEACVVAPASRRQYPSI